MYVDITSFVVGENMIKRKKSTIVWAGNNKFSLTSDVATSPNVKLLASYSLFIILFWLLFSSLLGGGDDSA